MKIYTRQLLFHYMLKCCLILLCVSLMACSDDNPSDNKNKDDLNTILKNKGQLSSFVQLLDRAGLESTLQQDGPFTVFAPSNEAFTAFLNGKHVSDIPVDMLKKYLPEGFAKPQHLSF